MASLPLFQAEPLIVLPSRATTLPSDSSNPPITFRIHWIKIWRNSSGSMAAKTRLKVIATGIPPGSFRCLRSHFYFITANHRILFQSSAPQRIAQTDINMISAKMWIVFFGSRGSVSVLNLRNRDLADISALGIREKTPFYRLSGRLTVQITFMFLPCVRCS